MQRLLTVLVALGVVLGGGVAVPALVTADTTDTEQIQTCQTISEPGQYTLGANLTKTSSGTCLQVESGDVVIDGAGHTLAGGGTGLAVEVNASEIQPDDTYQNVTVRDVRLESWETGISLAHTRNATISGIEVTDTTTGVQTGIPASRSSNWRPATADGTTIRESTFINNEEGTHIRVSDNVDVFDNRLVDSRLMLDLDEAYVDDVDIARNDIVDSDVVVHAGGPFVYSVKIRSNDVEDGTIRVRGPRNVTVANNTVTTESLRPPRIRLTNAQDTVVVNNTVSGPGTGIHMESSPDTTVSNNTIRDVKVGVDVDGGGANTVANNTISNTRTGVRVNRGIENTISGNEISDSRAGVSVGRSTENTISGNEISDSQSGISLGWQTENNVVEENTLTNNSDGVKVINLDQWSGGSNVVRGNEIHNNTDGVDVFATTNTLVVESNDLSGNGNGIHIRPPSLCYPDGQEGAELVSVHGNDLSDNEAYGVFNEGPDTLNATGNYWGASDGPSSADDPDAPFSDPVTGTLANGTGTAVSEDPRDPGESNVHFDQSLDTSPTETGVQNETAT